MLESKKIRDAFTDKMVSGLAFYLADNINPRAKGHRSVRLRVFKVVIVANNLIRISEHPFADKWECRLENKKNHAREDLKNTDIGKYEYEFLPKTEFHFAYFTKSQLELVWDRNFVLFSGGHFNFSDDNGKLRCKYFTLKAEEYEDEQEPSTIEEKKERPEEVPDPFPDFTLSIDKDTKKFIFERAVSAREELKSPSSIGTPLSEIGIPCPPYWTDGDGQPKLLFQILLAIERILAEEFLQKKEEEGNKSEEDTKKKQKGE